MTTFLVRDLIPALENGNCGSGKPGRRPIVIYVDLRSDMNVSPAERILRAVRAQLCSLATEGFRFRFDMTKLGEIEGATLAEGFCETVEQAQTDLILIVDEVQECLKGRDAQSLLRALKAARDAVNLRPATPGHFMFIGAGSSITMAHEMTAGTEAAFAGAVIVEIPPTAPTSVDPAR